MTYPQDLPDELLDAEIEMRRYGLDLACLANCAARLALDGTSVSAEQRAELLLHAERGWERSNLIHPLPSPPSRF